VGKKRSGCKRKMPKVIRKGERALENKINRPEVFDGSAPLRNGGGKHTPSSPGDTPYHPGAGGKVGWGPSRKNHWQVFRLGNIKSVTKRTVQ